MAQQQTIVGSDSDFSLVDWFQENSRAVGIGAALVLVGAAGYWFYMRSAQIKRTNAERGFNQAKQSLVSGNSALAMTDLQRVASRYAGTPAGAQAVMVLAGLYYDQGKFEEGLQALRPYQSGSTSAGSLAAIWSLTGDGQLSSGKADDAASSYKKAAEAIALPGEKAMYEAKAARAYMAVGKNAEARAIWEKLANDPDAVVVRNEAQIRLGELSAQPAARP